jgi:hypothetical protein
MPQNRAVVSIEVTLATGNPMSFHIGADIDPNATPARDEVVAQIDQAFADAKTDYLAWYDAEV